MPNRSGLSGLRTRADRRLLLAFSSVGWYRCQALCEGSNENFIRSWWCTFGRQVPAERSRGSVRSVVVRTRLAPAWAVRGPRTP